MLEDIEKVRCISCNWTSNAITRYTFCPKCGKPFIFIYNLEKLKERVSKKELRKRAFNMWRYLELLPISSQGEIVSLGEGGTFLHKANKLAKVLGIKNLLIKDETTNPTGSYLDRGSSVLASMLVEMGYSSIIGAVGGNLGASLSAYMAKAGIKGRFFMPLNVDLGKLYQVLAYGPELHMVKDLEEGRRRALSVRIDEYLIDDRDPYIAEGKKTIFWEIVEQLQWETPDWIIAPMASGGLVSMIYQAYLEMKNLGFLEDPPRIVGVQPLGSPSIVNMITGIKEYRKESIIYDLSVIKPVFLEKAIEAIKKTNGRAVAVEDEEMYEYTRKLARNEGIFAEPAAASTLAALDRLLNEGVVSRGDIVVCLITGSGLKDPRTIKWEEGRKLKKKWEVGHLERTKKLILQIVAEGERYGYEIWRELKNRGIEISLPAVYQHLSELLSLGLLRKIGVVEVRRRKRTLYGLTNKGMALAFN